MCDSNQRFQHESRGFNSEEPCSTGCSKTKNVCIAPYSPWRRAEFTRPIIPISAIPVSHEKLNLKTTYQTQFIPRPMERTKSYRPNKMPVKSSGEFQNTSMYREQFRAYCIDPNTVIKRQREYTAPTGPLNGNTTYKQDYQPKMGRPAESTKRANFWDLNPPRFDDLTTYRMQFTPYCLETRANHLKAVKDEKKEWEGSCVPFQGTTTYKVSYQPVKPCPAKSVKPTGTRYKQSGDFDDRTVYRSAYEPYYFGDCIPASLQEAVYPARDVCSDVRCFEEPCRDLGEPQRPSPPCPQKTGTYCPSPYEMRCSPKILPCVSPYKIKTSMDSQGGTTIDLTNNENGQMRAGYPAEIDCPPANEMPFLVEKFVPKISALYRRPKTPPKFKIGMR